MMKRIFAWALVFILACMPAAANAADDFDAIIGGILAHLNDGKETEEWIRTGLCAYAGSGIDGIIPALLHMDKDYDFSNYAQALQDKINSGIKSITTRQRSALMLSVLDPSRRMDSHFADETIGEMGVMSYVFGLHLLNNGFKSDAWTIDTLADMLACLQLEDGGWAVSGKYSDPDVTSMCLQALSLCDDGSDASRKMIDLALSYLSGAQLEDGGFASYGSPACESSAQVIIALISLGIDPLSDPRFIKNGNTALDAMLSFRLPDGSFSHLAGGVSNDMACIQALSALVALQNSEKALYDFSGIEAVVNKSTLPAFPLWKTIAFGIIALFALLGTIVSLFKKRARGKRILLLMIVCAIAAFAVWMINIESASGYYSEIKTDRPVAGEVWMSISCDKVAGKANDGSTPENGKILPRTQIDYYEGDSVFDVLTYAVRKYGIHLEADGTTGNLAYINGINHLYEHAYGELSGWIYLVNGEKLSVGCSNHLVQNGDEIKWEYTLNLGEDVK